MRRAIIPLFAIQIICCSAQLAWAQDECSRATQHVTDCSENYCALMADPARCLTQLEATSQSLVAGCEADQARIVLQSSCANLAIGGTAARDQLDDYSVDGVCQHIITEVVPDDGMSMEDCHMVLGMFQEACRDQEELFHCFLQAHSENDLEECIETLCDM